MCMPFLVSSFPLQEDSVELPRKRRRVQRFVENFSSSIHGMEWDPNKADLEYDAFDKEDAEAEKNKTLEPHDFSVATRDRVHRGLMYYGFGRWNRVESMAKTAGCFIPAITKFAIFMVTCCGMYAEETGRKKETNDFVRKARAQATAELERFEQTKIQMPPSLLSPDYVTKLKQGIARKTLIRLESLKKVHAWLHVCRNTKRYLSIYIYIYLYLYIYI
jgi:hypothetical protein